MTLCVCLAWVVLRRCVYNITVMEMEIGVLEGVLERVLEAGNAEGREGVLEGVLEGGE